MVSAVTALLDRARRRAEQLMTDTCVIRRSTGNIVVDPDTGVATPEYTLVYEGKCKLQTAGGIASQVVSASGDATNVGGNVPVWSLYLHLPMSAADCLPGDLAQITASIDPALVGRRLRLVNLQSEKTHTTARRWNVSEMPQEGEANE